MDLRVVVEEQGGKQFLVWMVWYGSMMMMMMVMMMIAANFCLAARSLPQPRHYGSWPSREDGGSAVHIAYATELA